MLHRNLVPDVYEIPRQKFGNPIPWLTALVIVAMVLGGTLTLLVANQGVPSDNFIITGR